MEQIGKAESTAVRLRCDICGYKASRKTLLILHKENKHEGVRYVCDICNFKTIKESFLAAHKQVQYEGKRFNCNECDFQAKFRRKVKVHFERRHSQGDNDEGVAFTCNLCN